MITITLIPVLKDNYAYLLEDDSSMTGVVDPSEPGPIEQLLKEKNIGLDYIFNTHHHWDHVGGNPELKKRYGAKLVGPESDRHRIKDMDIGLSDGDEFSFGGDTIKVIATPGHTSGHVCLYFQKTGALFCGDTLFSMGCGRLFEGTAEEMFTSLSRLKDLPDDTKIYCGHEYTKNNGDFCLSIEPDNKDLKNRMKDVEKLRSNDQPTIPSTMGLEKKTNVFLRTPDAATFAEYRAQKDAF